MEAIQQSRYEQCIKDLTDEFEKNRQFAISFNNYYEYYKQKFWKYIKEKPSQREFSEEFFNYAQQLFLEGYFVVDEYIHQPTTENIPQEFLSQPNGMIRQQSFDILNAEQGLEDIISLDTTVPFESKLLNEYEKAEHLLYEVKRDLILLGGSYRFIKERERQEILIKSEPEEHIKGILHRSDDLFFVDPQKYFACTYTNPTTELWSLNYWATLEKNDLIGSLIVQKFLKNDLHRMYQELPIYETQKPSETPEKYLVLTLTVEQPLTKDELDYICSSIIQTITKRQDADIKDIHLRVSKAQGMLFFQPFS